MALRIEHFCREVERHSAARISAEGALFPGTPHGPASAAQYANKQHAEEFPPRGTVHHLLSFIGLLRRTIMVVSSRATLRDQAGVKLVRIERLANQQREVSFPCPPIEMAASASSWMKKRRTGHSHTRSLPLYETRSFAD